MGLSSRSACSNGAVEIVCYVLLRRGLRVAIYGAQGKPATTHVEPEPVQGTKEGDSELAI